MEENIINTTKTEINLEDVKNICNLTFAKLNVVNPIFSITFVDNSEIRRINKEYRNKDAITDVISFAFEERDNIKIPGVRILGDIYISVDKAISQSKDYGHSLKRELCFLTVHGLLHILGYDHINQDDEKIMFKLQEEILESYDAKR